MDAGVLGYYVVTVVFRSEGDDVMLPVRAVMVLAAASWLLVGASSCSNSGGSAANGGGNAASSSSSGSSSSAAKSSAPAIVPIGTPMKASSGDQMVVTAFGPYSSGNQFEAPAAGKECDQVALTFTNGSSGEWLLPTSEVGVVDANGQKYTESFTCGTSDTVDSVVAGGHASAKMYFEVPKGSPLNLSWVPNQFESEVHQTKLR